VAQPLCQVYRIGLFLSRTETECIEVGLLLPRIETMRLVGQKYLNPESGWTKPAPSLL
jgi:hypothetical protein